MFFKKQEKRWNKDPPVNSKAYCTVSKVYDDTTLTNEAVSRYSTDTSINLKREFGEQLKMTVGTLLSDWLK